MMWFDNFKADGEAMFCSTIKQKTDDVCEKENGNNISDNEVALSDNVTIQGLDLYGLKMVYYVVEHGEEYGYNGLDKVFGEDGLEEISRAFYFKGYMSNIPSNVRTYAIQGIEGSDILTVYAAKKGFDYFSTYGGNDRNTPELFEERVPMIEDIIYLPNNNTFYSVMDVKYFDNAFGLASHTYTLTLKVCRVTQMTVVPVADTPLTILPDDPIYDLATSSYPPYVGTEDIFKLNDVFTSENFPNLLD